ncbi:Pyrimidine 5'-nucleotidase YjjG [Mesonia oceanica]|uniref:Pyrimidine 5'-nucleotidase YjjG n=1 Tax=Mesonia oceanica TaxID=2687242 RepID=A0AC61YAG7_9FLAO|nr:Pyrimidine 5'-nucleotidase YjjG [Mesonia oceanica]
MIMEKGIKHIFFDLDHTLWDFERNSSLAFQEIFEKHQVPVKIEDFLELYIPINNTYWADYRNDRINKEELRYGRLSDTFKAMNIRVERKQIDLLSEDYIAHLPKNNYLFEDVHSTLNYLQQKYSLHVITNGFSEVQVLKLKNSKIEDYFMTVTTSEEAGVKKPHPDIFGYALEKAKALPTESLMIGDNLEADIMGAENFGIKAVLFGETVQTSNYSGKKINKLKQLLEFI